MIAWINQNYKVITGAVIPIIVAIIGLFKAASLIKKRNSLKGNNNNQLQSDGDIKNSQSFNSSTLTAAPNSHQTIVYGNQTTVGDLKSVEAIARDFVVMMYPNAEIALNKLRLNCLDYLKILDMELNKLSKDELEKFSESEVQIALQNSIKSAAKRNIPEIHQTLARLIADRVQKPKKSIAELAIEESIEIISKLDANLIKILSLCFIFSRTKYTNIQNQEQLFEKLLFVTKHFEKIDITMSKFEYLEAISCGKLQQFVSSGIIDSIAKNYPHLFINDIPINQVKEINFPQNIEIICFTKSDEKNFKPNQIIGLHIFENIPIFINNVQITLNDDIKEKLKDLYSKNMYNSEEIESILCKKIKNFSFILDLWKEHGFSNFSLTSVGIAIAISYLSKAHLGEYDINVWVN